MPSPAKDRPYQSEFACRFSLICSRLGGGRFRSWRGVKSAATSSASLKRHGLIDGSIRAPQPGAPFAYVTTRKFLEAFGLASVRDLPDLERLKAEGRLQRGQGRPTSTARSALQTAAKKSTGFRATLM